MAKKFAGDRGPPFAEAKGVTVMRMRGIQMKGKTGLEVTRLPLRKETKVFRNQVRSESAFVSLLLCAESQPVMAANSCKPIRVDSCLIRG